MKKLNKTSPCYVQVEKVLIFMGVPKPCHSHSLAPFSKYWNSLIITAHWPLIFVYSFDLKVQTCRGWGIIIVLQLNNLHHVTLTIEKGGRECRNEEKIWHFFPEASLPEPQNALSRKDREKVSVWIHHYL